MCEDFHGAEISTYLRAWPQISGIVGSGESTGGSQRRGVPVRQGRVSRSEFGSYIDRMRGGTRECEGLWDGAVDGSGRLDFNVDGR